MKHLVLVLNSGSSSVKFQLFDMDREETRVAGAVSRVGEADGEFHYRGGDTVSRTLPIADHGVALETILSVMVEQGDLPHFDELLGIGHRVVHGGRHFAAPALIDEQVITAIRDTIPLAPLHNPANLQGIEVARKAAPGVPQVAVFDTAFHQTLPPEAYRYAVPEAWYTSHHVRRYGFHGTSHQYVSERAAEMLGRPPSEVNLVSLHLGNGTSAAAVRGGVCVDTSMGMTPLEGLVMGTRSGDLDPAIPFYLMREAGLDAKQVEAALNRESGLAGICGRNDMREIEQQAAAGDPDAQLALDLFCYRIRKYVGAYTAVLGKLDALVFTAGIGEHSAGVRSRVCAGLEGMGIRLDDQRNQAVPAEGEGIHHPDSTVAILVVPTNEELQIARQTRDCIGG